MPNKLHGTLLARDQWQDNLRMRYRLRPIGLCSHCDGCRAVFSADHGLSCKKEGLVTIRHDDTRNEAGALAALTLTPGRISYKLMINYGRDLSAAMPNAPQATGSVAWEEARGDVLVHGLWERGSGCVLDTRVTDTDAKSYQKFFLTKVLEKAARQKKGKYIAACLARRQNFVPLVYSVDGMACKEAKAFEKRIAPLLATKWDRSHIEMTGHVRKRMGLAIIMSNTMLLPGARSKWREVPELEDAAGYEAVQERHLKW